MKKDRALSLARSIIILPGTVLIFVPGLILWLSKDTAFAAQFVNASRPQFWLGIILLAAGLTAAVWTVILQLTIGEGTPAPWDPPLKLVIRGPYIYVRNPMITGVFLVLTAQALLLQSWPIATWLMVFIVANLIYIPKVEEKDLERRFGQAYLTYKSQVPRWLPRLAPRR